jgi:hypothetical protein
MLDKLQIKKESLEGKVADVIAKSLDKEKDSEKTKKNESLLLGKNLISKVTKQISNNQSFSAKVDGKVSNVRMAEIAVLKLLASKFPEQYKVDINGVPYKVSTSTAEVTAAFDHKKNITSERNSINSVESFIKQAKQNSKSLKNNKASSDDSRKRTGGEIINSDFENNIAFSLENLLVKKADKNIKVSSSPQSSQGDKENNKENHSSQTKNKNNKNADISKAPLNSDFLKKELKYQSFAKGQIALYRALKKAENNYFWKKIEGSFKRSNALIQSSIKQNGSAIVAADIAKAKGFSK